MHVVLHTVCAWHTRSWCVPAPRVWNCERWHVVCGVHSRLWCVPAARDSHSIAVQLRWSSQCRFEDAGRRRSLLLEQLAQSLLAVRWYCPWPQRRRLT